MHTAQEVRPTVIVSLRFGRDGGAAVYKECSVRSLEVRLGNAEPANVEPRVKRRPAAFQ